MFAGAFGCSASGHRQNHPVPSWITKHKNAQVGPTTIMIRWFWKHYACNYYATKGFQSDHGIDEIPSAGNPPPLPSVVGFLRTSESKPRCCFSGTLRKPSALEQIGARTWLLEPTQLASRIGALELAALGPEATSVFGVGGRCLYVLGFDGNVTPSSTMQSTDTDGRCFVWCLLVLLRLLKAAALFLKLFFFHRF